MSSDVNTAAGSKKARWAWAAGVCLAIIAAAACFLVPRALAASDSGAGAGTEAGMGTSADADAGLFMASVQEFYLVLTDPSAAEVVFAEAQASEPVADYSWYSSSKTSFSFSNEGSGKNIINKLIGLRNIVAGTASGISADSFAGKTIALKSAVNLAGLEWTPIGSETHPFEGTFDGGGMTISGFVISQTYTDAGFFGVTGSSSEIRNVNVAAGNYDGVAIGSASAPYSAGAIACVGSLVGDARGKISSCTSGMNVTICTAFEPGSENSVILDSVGGLVGRCSGDMASCTYTGAVDISSSSSTADGSDDLLMTCIGGVVGFFGDLTDPGSTTVKISECVNEGSVKLKLDGSAAEDRFGVDVNAQAGYVGGVAGYSTGSVVSCANTGSIDTSYQLESTFTASSTDASNITACGSYMGGVVGGLRSDVLAGMTGLPDGALDAGAGAADNPVSISKSYNTGSVFGHHSVGGILGSGGWYSTVTSSYCSIPTGNATLPSKPAKESGQSDDEYYKSEPYLQYLDELYAYYKDIGGIKAARWNKPMAGGIVGKTYGNVSYCYNTSRVWSTTNAGYYVAGIAGTVFCGTDLDGYEAPTPEVWACYNTGYAQSGLRAASLIGDNEGYVHDCYALSETSYYSSGSSERLVYTDSGTVSRCSFVGTVAELSATEAIAALNYMAGSEGWASYFVQAASEVNDGLPVLDWQDSGYDPVDLTSAGSSVVLSLVRDADYDGSAVVPTLSVSYTSGGQTIDLVQGADFKVVVDLAATERTLDADRVTGTRPYTATIQGLGRYSGTPAQSVSYGIVVGDLASCSLVVDAKTYTGSVLELSASEVRIYSPTGVLVPSDAYTFTVNDGKECISRGTYLVAATTSQGSSGNYQGTLSEKAFTIGPADLYRACSIEGISSGDERYSYDDNSRYVDMTFTYTGSAIYPQVDAVSYTPAGGSRMVLRQGTSATDVNGDYNVKYLSDSDYTNVSYEEDGSLTELSMTVEANNSTTIGNYHNYAECSFSIAPADISSADVVVPDQAHTGAARGNTVITFNGSQLVEGSDYTVSYSNNVDVGTATATIVGKGNFTGTLKKTYRILDAEPTDISAATVSAIADQGWTGSQVMPAVTVKDASGTVLSEGTDYILTYSDNVDAGTAKVLITGVGMWSGSDTKTFAIVKHAVSVAAGFGKIGTMYTTNTVNGTAAKIDGNTSEDNKPTIDVGLGKTVEVVVVRSTGFNQTCNLTGIVVIGDESGSSIPVSVTSLENDTSSSGTNRLVCSFEMPDEDVTIKTLSYTTATNNLSSCSIDAIADQVYTGLAVTPSIVVRDGSKTLVPGRDYGLFSYSYSNNIEPGTATVMAVGMGSYTGSVSSTFAISPSEDMTVSADDVEVVYDGASHGVVASASVSGATILYGTSADSCTQEASPTFVDAGEHVVYFTATAPGMKASGSAKVVITLRAAVVAANPAVKGEGGSDPEFSATVTGVLPADEGCISYTISRPGAGSDEAIGVYKDAIVPAGEAVQGNYQVEYVPADFTISTDAPLSVSAADVSSVYDGGGHGVSATATIAGAVIRYGTSADECTLESSPQYTDAGTYTVYFTAVAAGQSASGSATVSISKARLVLSVEPLSKTYGDANPSTDSAVVSAQGLVGDDTLESLGGTSVSILGVSNTSPAATYENAVRAGMAGSDPKNYTVEDAMADFTVVPKDLSTCAVEASALKGHAYSGQAITPVPDVTIDGLSAVYSASAVADNPRTFTVTYADSAGNACTPIEEDYYTVYICGSGNYTGTATTTTSFFIYSTQSSEADGWHIAKDGTKTYRRNGELVKGEFIKIDKETGELVASDSNASSDTYDVYYLRLNGSMATGLARVYGIFRFFGDNGVRRYGPQNVVWKNVINDDGTHNDGAIHEMYFDNAGSKPTGCMLSGFVKIDKTTGKNLASKTKASADTYDVYYYRINGAKLYGLAKIYGAFRYFDPATGIRQYGRQSVLWNGAVNDDTGSLAHNDGAVHEMYFDAHTGIMASGTFLRLNEDGVVDASSDDVYYYKIVGEKATGLVKVYGYWRYFGDDGVRRYGWQNVEGKMYYFDKTAGIAYTGKREIDGAIYTFDSNGVLQ